MLELLALGALIAVAFDMVTGEKNKGMPPERDEHKPEDVEPKDGSEPEAKPKAVRDSKGRFVKGE